VIRVVFTSDTHLGLMTEDVSRTDEILSVMLHIAKHAVKTKADYLIIGGDVFDNNTPTDYLIACFIRMLNILKKADIKVFVMPGNHDAIARQGRRSCLEFIKKLSVGYPNVRLIEDVTTIKIRKDFEAGAIYFTFLPFLNKSHIPDGFKSVQQYVDLKARTVSKKIKELDQHVVFSHLGIEGAIPGSEAGSLKKVETIVPKVFTQMRLGRNYPTVVQAHIHSKQEIKNVRIVGSPVFNDFGEKEESKFFLEIQLPRFMEDKTVYTYHKTPCRPFVEIVVDMDHKLAASMERTTKLDNFMHGVHPNSIVKISVTAPEDLADLPWDKYRKHFQKRCFYVKPIRPKIIRKRVKRNSKQTITLAPKQAIKLWIKSNKPKYKKLIRRTAFKYLGLV
jgi:exonuclease SbcD